MGCNEISNQDQLNFLDPFKGANSRKFRPLAPRLNFSPPNNNTYHLLSLSNTNNRHQHNLFEESNSSKEVVGTNQVMVSSRWNPTPEQLRALEELYRRGTRTPSAEQIQHITANLRRYGKIEGKNVFYWFQNHKARERQKRRRQLQLHPPSPGSTTGGNRVGFEGEQKSCKWTPSSTNKETDRPINQIITVPDTSEAKAEDTSTTTSSSDNNINIININNNNNNNSSFLQFHDPPQFQHNHFPNYNINTNIPTPRNLIFAGQRNDTWHPHNNNNYNNNNSSCCYCYPSHPPFSLNLLPAKQVINGQNSPPLSSPTLQLFPVFEREIQEENDVEIVRKEGEVDIERENDESLLLLQATCCNNLVEKATSINTNNPFPYYHFL